jgi:hypothetical protein
MLVGLPHTCHSAKEAQLGVRRPARVIFVVCAALQQGSVLVATVGRINYHYYYILWSLGGTQAIRLCNSCIEWLDRVLHLQTF